MAVSVHRPLSKGYYASIEGALTIALSDLVGVAGSSCANYLSM